MVSPKLHLLALFVLVIQGPFFVLTAIPTLTFNFDFYQNALKHHCF